MIGSVADIAEVLGGERTITIARELTKMFESIHSCKLAQAAAWLALDPDRVRGEFVLLVEGAAVEDTDTADSAAARRVLGILASELPLKQAVKLTTEIAGGKRNELYALALEMKNPGDRE